MAAHPTEERSTPELFDERIDINIQTLRTATPALNADGTKKAPLRIVVDKADSDGPGTSCKTTKPEEVPTLSSMTVTKKCTIYRQIPLDPEVVILIDTLGLDKNHCLCVNIDFSENGKSDVVFPLGN